MGETEEETKLQFINNPNLEPKLSNTGFGHQKKKNLQQNLHHAVTSLSIKFKRVSILEVKIRLWPTESNELMNQARLGEAATDDLQPAGQSAVGRRGVVRDYRERVLQPLTQAVFWDDDFMRKAWQWQQQMDDEIHPVTLRNTDTRCAQPSWA